MRPLYLVFPGFPLPMPASVPPAQIVCSQLLRIGKHIPTSPLLLSHINPNNEIPTGTALYIHTLPRHPSPTVLPGCLSSRSNALMYYTHSRHILSILPYKIAVRFPLANIMPNSPFDTLHNKKIASKPRLPLY